MMAKWQMLWMVEFVTNFIYAINPNRFFCDCYQFLPKKLRLNDTFKNHDAQYIINSGITISHSNYLLLRLLNSAISQRVRLTNRAFFSFLIWSINTSLALIKRLTHKAYTHAGNLKTCIVHTFFELQNLLNAIHERLKVEFKRFFNF